MFIKQNGLENVTLFGLSYFKRTFESNIAFFHSILQIYSLNIFMCKNNQFF